MELACCSFKVQFSSTNRPTIPGPLGCGKGVWLGGGCGAYTAGGPSGQWSLEGHSLVAASELCCLLAGGWEAPLRQVPLAFTQALSLLEMPAISPCGTFG